MTEKEWLGETNTLGIDIWNKKYRYREESFEQWLDRISCGDLELRKLIQEKKFLFGGRALSNINTDDKSSYFNCYSRGFIEDDINDILKANTDIALTYKAQGGQGLSLSKLRPKGTPVGNRFQSDGIIPFMKMYNETTSAISQGGSRKGALMISLDCRHKEIEDFIKIKTNETDIQKANLSLEVDNKFMEAVEKFYTNGEEITLHERRNYNEHIVEYDIVPIKIFKLMCQTCYDWADPAILYTDRFRNYNLMEFVDDYKIETSNPCGEQPLPKNFCCNLGSLNLAEFVKNPFEDNCEFNYDEFKRAIKISVRALDVLVDKNSEFHPLQEQKENSLNYRNIGLGVMGFADMLMMLKIKYGSEESKKITDKVFDTLFKIAVGCSFDLAKEKGTFPKYSDKLFDSTIIKKHFSETEINQMKEIGLRNCSLISIAPTGSIATMLGRSGGCEPEFAISYQRKTESLNNGEDKFYNVFCLTAQEYIKTSNNKDLPEYFISSSEIDPYDRIEIQSIMQNYVDTAISSTINLPNTISVEAVEQIYLNAWKKGLKGITIYRSGCKRTGILTTDTTSTTSNQNANLHRGDILQVNDDVIGRKRKLMTGCGSLHCTAFFDPVTGELLETYLSKGSAGGCNNFMISLSRMISLASRAGVDIYTLVDQLNSCGACPSYAVRTATKKDTSKGSCCPIAVGNALIGMYREVRDELGIEDIEQKPEESNAVNPCSQCGEELVFEGGCNVCKSCGWSKCN